MATATVKNPRLRVAPLAEADILDLEALFDEQCDEWLRLLRWDYSRPSQLIREVARLGELSGFVALAGGEAVGFAFYIVEDRRCSIGDIYVAKEWRGAGADRLLVAAILDHLGGLPRVRRVESQCVGIGNEAANELLVARGFHRFDRHYMMLDLKAAGRPAAGTAAAPEVTMRHWRDEDFGAAARIIHRSYRGEHDSRINSQYQSEEGCAELLSVLTDHIWCGDFLPRVSRVAVGDTRKPVGVLVASRIAPRAGHIGQISILPEHQGRGLGRRLIDEALDEYAGLGFETVSLAVTMSNAPAVRLYQSCGFRTVHKFAAFYRE